MTLTVAICIDVDDLKIILQRTISAEPPKRFCLNRAQWKVTLGKVVVKILKTYN